MERIGEFHKQERINNISISNPISSSNTIQLVSIKISDIENQNEAEYQRYL